jgi:hypothetical protein
MDKITANKWNRHKQGDPCPCDPDEFIHSMHVHEMPDESVEMQTITNAGQGWITGGLARTYDFNGPYVSFWRRHHGPDPVLFVDANGRSSYVDADFCTDGFLCSGPEAHLKAAAKWRAAVAAQPGEVIGNTTTV